jgi:hypothetical protein
MSVTTKRESRLNKSQHILMMWTQLLVEIMGVLAIIVLVGVISCGEASELLANSFSKTFQSRKFHFFFSLSLSLSLSDKGGKVAGCEKADEFKTLTPMSCCEGYPNPHNPAHLQDCAPACVSVVGHMEKMCCFTNCTLLIENILNAKGEYDNAAAIKFFTEQVDKNEAWADPIKKSIEECVKEGELSN